MPFQGIQIASFEFYIDASFRNGPHSPVEAEAKIHTHYMGIFFSLLVVVTQRKDHLIFLLAMITDSYTGSVE